MSTPVRAPRPGWYPAPEGGVRLRWWDGTDWTDTYRSRPGAGELLANARAATGDGGSAVRAASERLVASGGDLARPPSRADTDEIINQVRQVARSEVERAADLFSARARAATRDLEPLISQYSSRFFRWVKIVLAVVVVLVIAWLVFAAIADVTFFDWLGDRIDNLTE